MTQFVFAEFRTLSCSGWIGDLSVKACGQEVFLQKELHCAKPWEKVLLNIWVLSYNCLPVWTSVLELNALKMI